MGDDVQLSLPFALDRRPIRDAALWPWVEAWRDAGGVRFLASEREVLVVPASVELDRDPRTGLVWFEP